MTSLESATTILGVVEAMDATEEEHLPVTGFEGGDFKAQDFATTKISNKNKALLTAAKKGEWIRVYQMTSSPTTPPITSPMTSSYGDTSTSSTDLLSVAFAAYASLELGEPIDKVQSRLRYVYRISSKKVNGDLELLLALSVSEYALAVVESRIGGGPLIAAEYAAKFVDRCAGSKSQASRNQYDCLPLSSWLPRANSILETAENSVTAEARRVTTKPLTAAEDWQRILKQFTEINATSVEDRAKLPLPPPPPVMNDLLNMTGLESVKLDFIKEYHKVCIAAEQEAPLQGSSYNLRCDGNPGTGKTTVAKIYGTFLQEVGILPNTSVVECSSGSALTTGGVKELEKHLKAIKSAGGGVMFIDEAYQVIVYIKFPSFVTSIRRIVSILPTFLIHSVKPEGGSRRAANSRHDFSSFR